MKQCELVFAEERLTVDLVGELWPLLNAHRDEVSVFLDVPLAPDWNMYQKLEEANILRLFTARADGALVGYAIYTVTRHLHYDIKCAMQDVLYLAPEFRKGMYARRLIAYSESCLAAIGVKIVTQHSKKHKDLSSLLTFLKYQPMDTIWYKRL